MATNIMGLVDYVQNKGELGKQQGQQSRLASLASQAYTTPAGQQSALLGQMAQVSPEFAQGQQQQFQQQGDDRARKAAGAAKYVLSAVERGDPAAIQGAYRTVYPYLSELVTSGGGQAPPEQWDPVMAEGMHQILAAAEGGSATGQGVQSTYVDDQGQRVAIMRDGSTRVLGGNDAGATQQTITIDGPDGRPAQYTFNRRTGNYEPATLGGQPQAAPQAQSAPRGQPGMTQVQYSTSDGQAIPANEQAAAQAAFAASARGESFDFPANGPFPQAPRQQSQGRSPFVGRSPDEQAALTTAAQEQAKADVTFRNYDRMVDNETESARRVSEATGEGKAAVEFRQNYPQAKRKAESLLNIIDKAINHPGRELVTGMSGLVDPRAYLRGGPAAGFNTILDQINGKSFLEAFESLKGGGQITEVEGQKATQAMARMNTSQSDEEFLEALQDFRSIIGDSLGLLESNARRYGAGQGEQPPPAQGSWGIQRVGN